MSQENVEIVRREVAARSTRDWHALEEIWHPDIQLEVTSGFEAVTGAAAFTGVREIRPFFEACLNSTRSTGSKSMNSSTPAIRSSRWNEGEDAGFEAVTRRPGYRRDSSA